MKRKDKRKDKREQRPNPFCGSGQVTYYEGGYGNRTLECPACGGSGRVYEGGYGNRRCPLC